MLHDVFDQDEKLQANLRKANKRTYKVLHPGDNKQSVPLALEIFDSTTSAAAKSYFPECDAAAKFLELINAWWTMSNSKQKLNVNFHAGDAATPNDCKPAFLRQLATWFSEWKMHQSSNVEKYTLTRQTTSALVVTLRCTASLIEDLLNDGSFYVLTGRFQTDPLECRFSRYRQMSGGRFLMGLREVKVNERILIVKSLSKESISFWEEDIYPDSNGHHALIELNKGLETISGELENNSLDQSTAEVAAVVAGYIAKKMLKRLQCSNCQTRLTFSSDREPDPEIFEYILNLSLGGLTLPAGDLTHHVCKSFAMLELCQPIIRKVEMPKGVAAEHVLKLNDVWSFLCDQGCELDRILFESKFEFEFNLF